ncbi:TPA: hypothetical protein N3024_001565 [Klebsiella pneumoniae]|nr:hypothetical protein [Klebsiella pneumoniae]
MKLVLASLNPEHKYFIAFDQLDLGFDNKADDYISRLIGLLLAGRDINIAAKNAQVKFLVTVFLRDDIYNVLRFEDKNKITENFMSLIEWDTPRTTKTLKSLMEKDSVLLHLILILSRMLNGVIFLTRREKCQVTRASMIISKIEHIFVLVI